MILVLLTIVLLLLWKTKIYSNGYEGYIDREQSQMINGIFIILVFMRHFNQYVELNLVIELPFFYINRILGQLIVTTFMFYSGYGVMTSIMKNSCYLEKMPRKRILRTLILFDIAICIYVIMNWCLGIDMTWKQIVLSFLGWEGVGNSTWYIFAILMMYILTYVGFKISHGDLIRSLIITTAFVTAYVFGVRQFKDSQYYNTVFCYVMGLWYAFSKRKIDERLLNSNSWWLAVGGALTTFSICAYFRDTNLIINQVYYLLFVLAIVLLSMRVKINNPVFLWCGQNLLGLYILQRIPMVICREYGFTSKPYLCFFICVIVTTILTVVYRKYVIDKIKI